MLCGFFYNLKFFIVSKEARKLTLTALKRIKES